MRRRSYSMRRPVSLRRFTIMSSPAPISTAPRVVLPGPIPDSPCLRPRRQRCRDPFPSQRRETIDNDIRLRQEVPFFMLRLPFNQAKRVETPKERVPRHRWRRSKKWWGVLAAILIVALLVVRRNRSNDVERPEVETAVVERGDVRATVSATGILQPFTTVDVKSKAGGTILKMAVE